MRRARRRKQTQVVYPYPAFKNCCWCSNGWILVGRTQARRCYCWRIYQQQCAALAQAAQGNRR